MSEPRPVVLEVPVPAEDLGYAILVGSGLITRIGAELRRRHAAARVALISDTNVMPLYGDAVEHSLCGSEFDVVRFEVPAGEASKSPAMLVDLVTRMVDAGLSRKDAVVALGGGVVCDLAGMAAAVFMRGIPFLHCPTSLLAQVDASVGGKVAVDLPAGKNLLGAFHFPTVVCIDPSVLVTLPAREIGCGLAEMLKHGALFAPEHFDDVVASAEAIYRGEPAVVARLVATSVALKAACVARDPRENVMGGKGRALLNLGHTMGHAIEAASGYELLHGEAVSIGLRAAARLSERKGFASPGLERRFVAALTRLRLPVDLDAWLSGERGAAVERALARDKKRAPGTITYIALSELGQPMLTNLQVAEILGLLRP